MDGIGDGRDELEPWLEGVGTWRGRHRSRYIKGMENPGGVWCAGRLSKGL